MTLLNSKSKTLNTELIANCAVAIYLLSLIISRLILHNTLTLRICNVLLVTVGLFGIWMVIKDNEIKIATLFIGLTIMWLMHMAFSKTGFYSFVDFLKTVFYAGTAYLVMARANCKSIYSLGFYIVTSIVAFKRIALNCRPHDVMIDGTSYNYISVIAMFFLLLYFIKSDYPKDTNFILPAIVFCAVCVLGYGRGGIVTGIFFVLSVLLFSVFKTKNAALIYLGVATMAVAFFLLDSQIIRIIVDSESLRKFAIKGLDSSGRFEIWSTFFLNNSKNLNSFLWGSDPRLIRPDGNTHNSFIQIYASLGAVPFALSVVTYLIGVIKNMVNNHYRFFIAMITLAIRGMSDKIFCSGFNDIVFFVFVFSVLICAQGNNKYREG